MSKEEKVIYPMTIELNKTIKHNVYYLKLPSEIKEKWIELERCATNKQLYNLPTVSLQNILVNSLEGVVGLNTVSEYSDDSKWLICFEEIDMDILISYFKIWIDEFYVKGSIGKQDKKRKNGEDERVSKLADELKKLISSEKFEGLKKEEKVLFEDGKAIDKDSFSILPQIIIDSLKGKSINIHGREAKLLYCDKNEMITDTNVFCNKDDYYSFVIKLTVQTLPPFNKAYLNVDLSVRRWICRNKDAEGKNYIGNNKNCYIRTSENIMQIIKTQYSSIQKCNVWNSIDERCFNECKQLGKLPDFVDVLKSPAEYNSGAVNDILIPYQEGLSNIETSVKNGVSFNDRDDIMKFLKKYLSATYGINSNLMASQIKKKIRKSKCDFIETDTIENVDEEIIYKSKYFSEQLHKALDGKAANFEIYAEKDLQQDLIRYIKAYLGDSSEHKIKVCEYEDLFSELPIIENSSKEDNLIGYEIRVDEIKEELKNVSEPTVAVIAIHDADYYKYKYKNFKGNKNYDKNKSEINIDPKEAIRTGFALTGRLTQFITIEKYEQSADEIEKAKESYIRNKLKYEEKKAEDPSIIRPYNKPPKTINVNKAINGAVLDAFRQLGVVYDCSAIKAMKGKKIMGISICNYKTTRYGYIKPFPIIVTYDIDASKIMVYCDLLDKVEVPYWKAILGLSKLSVDKHISDLNKTISSTTIYRRLNRVLEKKEKHTIVIVEANGVTRKFIKGITNSELDKSEKNEFNQVTKLLINDDKYLELDASKSSIDVVRIRVNEEVPDYIHDDLNSKYQDTSGLFNLEEVYYSIDSRPKSEEKTYKKSESKAIKAGRYSHRNIVEIYPLFTSNDIEDFGASKMNSIEITNLMRAISIQFTAQMTILPLPLHLAKKMEEYL